MLLIVSPLSAEQLQEGTSEGGAVLPFLPGREQRRGAGAGAATEQAESERSANPAVLPDRSSFLDQREGASTLAFRQRDDFSKQPFLGKLFSFLGALPTNATSIQSFANGCFSAGERTGFLGNMGFAGNGMFAGFAGLIQNIQSLFGNRNGINTVAQLETRMAKLFEGMAAGSLSDSQSRAEANRILTGARNLASRGRLPREDYEQLAQSFQERFEAVGALPASASNRSRRQRSTSQYGG